MEKLQLREVAPYLAYKLQIQHGDRIKTMNTAQGSSVYWIGLSAVLKWVNSPVVETRPALILRPLSDLTKPIEVNGETFVPIVELAKISFLPRNVRGKSWKEINGIAVAPDYELEFHFIQSDFQAFYKKNKTNVYNQYRLFEKLFEWHFDVFNLIERGLAIDINSLANTK